MNAPPVSCPDSGPQRQPDELVRSLIVGFALFLAYSANCRPIGAFDTMPATFLPVTLIRGDGLFLDRFQSVFEREDEGLHLSVTWSRGHIISRYPPGSPVLAVPLAVPQVLALDRLYPGWEQETPYRCLGMSKNASAAIAALLGVSLLHLLRALGLGRLRLLTMLAAALGSSFWTIASQSLWQHGPAALALTLALLLLVHPHQSRLRLFLAGLATAALVCFRSMDVLFAIVISCWVLHRHRKNVLWFVPMPVICAALLGAYNYYYFGTLLGGQGELEALHEQLHGVPSAWVTNPLGGAAGTLLSPSRGLFVFTPWTALALAFIPVVVVKLKPWPLVCWLLWALLPYYILLSFYAVWWGGHSFGPRYWTDVIPLLAIVLGFGLEWSWSNSRPAFVALVASILVSFGVQAIGAFCYPSSWETSPVDVDRHHERLWDWRDSEISRCLLETLQRN